MALSIPDPRWEMPELLIPGRKPIGAVEIDWSHPLTAGLKNFYLIKDENDKNLLNGQSCTYFQGGDGWTFGPSDGQWAGLCNAAGTDFNYIETHDDTFAEGGNNYTYLVQGRFDNDSTANIDILPASFGEYGARIQIQHTGANGSPHSVQHFHYNGAANSGSDVVLTGSESNTVQCIAALSKNGSMAVAANGTFFLEHTTSAVPAAVPSNPDRMFDTWGYSMDGALFLVAKWNRGLSESEAREITRDPYQIIIPK